MRAFLLLCSLLGLCLAQNNVNLFASRAGTSVTSAVNIPFTFNVDGTSYSHVIITQYGAIFPAATSTATNPMGNGLKSVPAYNSGIGYTVIGALWTTAFSTAAPINSGDNSVTYSTVSSSSNPSFFTTYTQQINSQFAPTDALVVTWWKMEDSTGDTVSVQLVLLTDNTGSAHSTYVFYLYGEINWFSAGNFRPGFSVAGDSSFNYESAYSSLKKIQTSNANNKAGQANFFYKLSATPFVDTHLAVAGTSSVTLSGNYIGVSFQPNVDSHGPTAFSFFKSSGNANNAPLPYAQTSSYLYCFTSPLSSPSVISTTHHFAKSNLASPAVGVWEFPSNHNFFSNTTYYCYCDTPISTTLVSGAAASKRNYKASFVFSSVSGTYQTPSGDFAYQLVTILFTTVSGDPVFKSLRTGDNFIFGGEPGKHFNLYHDRYVNLNGEFAYANAAKKEGTIISKVGVLVGGHKISFGAEDFAAGSLQINLDGKSVKLYNDKVHLSGCVDIHYLAKWSAFYIVSPTHKLKFTLDERHTEHMNGKFINAAVEDIPESQEDKDSLGGVIGQTIKAGPINTNAEDFAVSGLFAVENINFKAAEFEDCA